MKKINLVELLRDCPKGMELDCTMFEGTIILECVNIGDDFPIHIRLSNGDLECLTKTGSFTHNDLSKCVIFPKGKNTWDGFHRPFKVGDVVINASNKESNAFIYRGQSNYYYEMYVGLSKGCVPELVKGSDMWVAINNELRFATEEEKQKLFKAIKNNGYKWNAETMSLEIELNKFDINTLIPFESRVLVRDKNTEKWKVGFWGFYDIDNSMNYPYECCGNSFSQCIPYEGNEHLLGKTYDCDDYYKNW